MCLFLIVFIFSRRRRHTRFGCDWSSVVCSSDLAEREPDAIFSGVSAVGLTLGAGMLAPFLNLPEVLLRETGLFLIAYTALVGWLASRSSVPKALDRKSVV